MKSFQKAFLAAALVSFGGIAAAQNIAVVNGKPITRARADAFVNELTKQGQQDSPQLQALVRQELVDREILVQEAERRGLPAKPEVKFQLDNVRQQVLINALVQDQLAKSGVSDADVKAEYDRLTKSDSGKEYRARHILVEKEDEAKSIIDKLKKGGKFEDLAKQSKDPGSASKGGDLDWANAQSFVEPFSKAMVALEKGKFTETPVQTQFGWHVIRLDDTRAAKPPEFDQVKDQLAESMKRKKLQDFQQQLKAKAKIQ
ncbi:MAG: peptidylprolyl isomerase [Burkholderiaceae bacterium]|nr:peptidylprolyl isomerase [Burkholderiaceae bacterium]